MTSRRGPAGDRDEVLDELRQEVARLSARLAALEAAGPRAPAAGPAEPVAPPAPPGPPAAALPLDEETLLVLVAAAAAYLGKRPHLRQIRLVESGSWAQVGRVTIQASHALMPPPR